MLAHFCRLMMAKYGSPAAIGDGVMAQEFAEHFFVSPQPTLIEFHRLCQQLGIDIEAKKLPAVIGAHHYAYSPPGKYRLEYNREQWTGTSVFKVAHDLYEIIQETLEKVCRGYKAPRNPKKPTCMAPHANKFAAALVMNEELMRRAIIETGLDVVAIHHRFEKAYSAVAIRVVNILQESNHNKIQVFVAIYEPNEPERDPSLWSDCSGEKFQARYIIKTPGIRTATRTETPPYWRYLLPRKGDTVVPGGVVDAVIKEAKPLYVERVRDYDFWGSHDLACLAVPVFWYPANGERVVAKVILTVMPSEQATMLQPQLQRLKPDILPERFQL